MNFRNLLIVVVLFALSATAWGQAASRPTFLKLMQVQEYWDEESYDEAMELLEALLQRTRNDSYDFALVNQYLARHCVLADCEERIRPALETALDQKGLPEEMLTMLYLFYAQAVMAEEEFALARDYYEKWLDIVPDNPAASHLFAAAYSNYMTKGYPRAEELVVMAIDSSDAALDSWYQLSYEILMADGRPQDAEQVAKDLVEERPTGERAWRMLANHYLRMEEMGKALPVLAIAWSEGILTSQDDASRIVTLYAYVETPERAARLMQTLVDDAVVERDFDSLKRIGELWLLSRERKKAIAALELASDLAEDGETDELLAGIHFEEENWADAHDRYMRAIDRGADEDNERIHLLAGVSAMRAGMDDEARTSLEEAAKYDEIKSQARSMLRQLDES